MAEDATWTPKGAFFTPPYVTRSRVVLEMASELVAAPNQPYRQAKVLLRGQGSRNWPIALFGSSTNEGIDEVASGASALGIVNPASALTLAYRGVGRYSAPQPVRLLAVIPSADQFVFAIKSDTGIERFEEIGARRFPLKVSLRGAPDHCLHVMLDHICAAAGFTLDDVRSWGGEAYKEEATPPSAGSPKFQRVRNGEINAIFDEGAVHWVEEALAHEMTILPLREETVQKLEAMGYRRAVLERAHFPGLPRDVLTIDFSGWAIFVNADLPELLVAQMCAALEARKDVIPWEEPGPLPVERMARDAADTPIDVPLHPGAERYWRERGFIDAGTRRP